MKPYGIIYLITNLVNEKKYVGQTIQGLEKRWKQHILISKYSDYPLYLDMREYDINNFIIKQICECENQDELNNKEIYYIIEYDTIIDHHKGYNMNYGGKQNGKPSEETRKRMSASGKGRKFTEEHKRKIGESNIGKNLGKHPSDETKRKMHESHSGKNNYWYGKKLSEAHKRKLSEKSKLNTQGPDNGHAKFYKIIDGDGNTEIIKSLMTWCKRKNFEKSCNSLYSKIKKNPYFHGYYIEKVGEL